MPFLTATTSRRIAQDGPSTPARPPRRASLRLTPVLERSAPVVEHNSAAKANVRAHAWRALGRVIALVALDCAAFELLRQGIRFLRDGGAVGATVNQGVATVFPPGYLGGGQFASALILGLILTGSYGPGDRRRDPQRILTACTVATLLPLWSHVWTAPLLVSLQFTITAGLLGLAVLGTRLGLDAVLYRYAPAPLARTVLVGPAAECDDLPGRNESGLRQGFTMVGAIPTDGPAGCRIEDVRRRLMETRADTVMLCGQLDEQTFTHVVRAAVMAECRVLANTRRLGLAGLRPSIVWRRGQPLVELRAVTLRWQQLLLKRLLDTLLATAMLALLAPIMAVVAIWLAVGSPGPIVYGQPRLGRYGRSFRCFKFRSMYVDADERLKKDPELYREYLRNDYKLPDGSDPRITPIGRILRRSSLDELPQLWNVLKGDMSLVGPRPIVPDEIRHYDEDGQMLLLLKPGITGLWQVSGRSNVAYPERTNLELEYVERWTLGRDIGILLRTIPAVLAQRGAH